MWLTIISVKPLEINANIKSMSDLIIRSFFNNFIFFIATCALTNYRGSEFTGKTPRVHTGFLGNMRTINSYAKQCKVRVRMDLFPNEQNFDLDKSKQTFHHSLKEHHKISNMSKFRCEML